MNDDSFEQLDPKALKVHLLEIVASENLDSIPDDFNDLARFVIGSIRAVARRHDLKTICAFFYSEAAASETKSHGFTRVAHMQDGHGFLCGALVATNRDAYNGMVRSCAIAEPSAIMDELEALGFGDRCSVIWDPAARVATIYPNGVNSPDDHIRNVIASSDGDVSQDEVCAALDQTYKENLCNPSGRTVKLWVKGKLVSTVEDELERHLKGQLTTYFAGNTRRVKILSQTNMMAGRADLTFLQRSDGSGPRMVGVLELKVLRGPEIKDIEITAEGLSQGFYYRRDLDLPFATLALFDVAAEPLSDVSPLLIGQIKEHLEIVRVRRYPIYDSPKAWRDAGGYEAAAA